MVPFQNLAPSDFPGINIRASIFWLYINDLPNNYWLSYSDPRMYVDDTHLTYWSGNIHSIQSSLNEDLLNISCWLLQINYSETCIKRTPYYADTLY